MTKDKRQKQPIKVHSRKIIFISGVSIYLIINFERKRGRKKFEAEFLMFHRLQTDLFNLFNIFRYHRIVGSTDGNGDPKT